MLIGSIKQNNTTPERERELGARNLKFHVEEKKYILSLELNEGRTRYEKATCHIIMNKSVHMLIIYTNEFRSVFVCLFQLCLDPSRLVMSIPLNVLCLLLSFFSLHYV